MEDEKRKDLNESELSASSQAEKGESKEIKNGKKPPVKLIAIVAVVAVVAVAAIALLAGGGLAHTHEFGEWTTTKSATCEEDGVRERFCDCGETQSQVIAKTGHEYGEFTVVEEPTCVKEGLKESKCNNCDAKRTESIAVVDHKYGEWQTVQEPTCEGLGKSESVCTVCEDKKEKEIKATGHSYGSWVVTLEATCTADGSKEKSCSRCDGKISEAIKSTGHSLGVWVTSKQATCTEDGSKKQTCSKCDYTKTETIKATGHDMSDATCTKAKTCYNCGLTDGSALGHINDHGYCSRCDEYYDAYEALAYYVYKNGTRNSDGEYYISTKLDTTTFAVYTDSSGKSLNFRMLSYSSDYSSSTFITMDLVKGSTTQEVGMLWDDYYCNGKIYINTFNDTTKSVYSFYTDCPYSSLKSSLKDLMGSSISLMFTGTNLLIIAETDLDITMADLGVKNYN